MGPSAKEPARGVESQGQLLERQDCDGRGGLVLASMGGWRGMTSNGQEQRCKEAHRTLARGLLEVSSFFKYLKKCFIPFFLLPTM